MRSSSNELKNCGQSSISVLTEINIFSELLHSQEGLVSFFKLSSFANATRS